MKQENLYCQNESKSERTSERAETTVNGEGTVTILRLVTKFLNQLMGNESLRKCNSSVSV